MNTDYKKLFDSHFNNSKSLCSWDICIVTTNILQYFYNRTSVK